VIPVVDVDDAWMNAIVEAIGNMSESGLPPRVHPKTSNVADREGRRR
jgi:hypothetical protein